VKGRIVEGERRKRKEEEGNKMRAGRGEKGNG
jgi:hypothetical protein